jgi:hypothetical protein
MDAPRILMLEVAEQVAAVTLVSHLPGIQAVSVTAVLTNTNVIWGVNIRDHTAVSSRKEGSLLTLTVLGFLLVFSSASLNMFV